MKQWYRSALGHVRSGSWRSRGIVVGAAVGVVAIAAIGIATFVGGATSDDDDDDVRTVQPGAPGEETRELSDDDLADIALPGHTPADTAFIQDMIVHHQQALEMTALVEERTERTDLHLLADRMTLSQEAEIERMTEWLTDRGEDVPDLSDHPRHRHMPGMAGAEQLDDLEEAEGARFERLFLELMIVHHQGAITMVDDLYDAEGGLEPEVDGLARDIRADQDIEIERMQRLLAPEG